MSTEFIERYCSRHFQKYPNKSKEDVLKTLTHLYLNGRKLETIVGSKAIHSLGQITCKRVKVAYLHNNLIREIKNLDKLTQLTHLYLQWNRITKIENLDRLKNLRKLYLGYNEITRLEGVSKLNQLEELHLEYQTINHSNARFTFDSASLNGILVCSNKKLRILNVSGLSLTDLNFLKPLIYLEELIATDNCFNSAEDLAKSFSYLKYIRNVRLNGCPAYKNDIYYRNKITIRSESLEMLDGKQILGVTKAFLKSLNRVKMEKQQKENKKSTNVVSRSVAIELDPFKLMQIVAEAMIDTKEYKPWNLLSSKSPKLVQSVPKTISERGSPDEILSGISVDYLNFKLPQN